MIRALFICSQNKLRSPTAEHIFSKWAGVETDSAGLNNDAETTLSGEQLDWATVVFVMEEAHRNKLSAKFRRHLNGKRVVCLNIPDEYEFMQPELIRMLEARAGRHLQMA